MSRDFEIIQAFLTFLGGSMCLVLSFIVWFETYNPIIIILFIYSIVLLVFFVLKVQSIINEGKPPKPSLIRPEEITQLMDFLINIDVRNYIKYLHFTKRKTIQKIAQKLEKKYKLTLFHKKGRLSGKFISGIDDKISEILGYKSYDDYLTHEQLKRSWNIEVTYDLSGDNEHLDRNIISIHGIEISEIEKWENYEKIRDIEERAQNYYDLGNFIEALKWYEKELELLPKSGVLGAHKIQEVQKKIEELKRTQYRV